jgi:hypothetical protein
MENDWVEVGTYTWLREASVIKSVLAAADIDAVIPSEHTLGIQPGIGQLVDGVHVFVRRQDLERAMELLESPLTAEGEGEGE